jgi:hypothetical protein
MTPSEQGVCAECNRALTGWRSRATGRLLCNACHKRATRGTAQWAERDREVSRHWKRLHLGQPGLPRGRR